MSVHPKGSGHSPVFKGLILAVLLLVLPTTPAHAGDSRLPDSVGLVRDRTGIGLKEAFEAVMGQSSDAATRLVSYSGKRGSQSLVDRYRKRVVDEKERCKERSARLEGCSEDVKRAAEESKFIDRLLKKARGTGAESLRHRILAAALIYAEQVRLEILPSQADAWKRLCTPPAVVGASDCRTAEERFGLVSEVTLLIGGVAVQRLGKVPALDPTIEGVAPLEARFKELAPRLVN